MRLPRARTPERNDAATLRHAAEQAASVFPPLLVAAERVAVTVAQGVHGRRRIGQGDSFWQYRRYQSGDASSSIDWRQSAKSQSYFVRENEWEAAQSVWLWRDSSPSMRFRSSEELPEKATRAAIIALALASLLVRGSERVALLDEGIRPSSSRAVLPRLANVLSREAGDRPSVPVIRPLSRYGRLVMISDFLSPLEEIEPVVRAYAGHGVRGHLLQVLDPVEDELPFQGRIRFEGLEGEGMALIGRTEMVRDEYLALMRAQRQGLADIARRVGWTFATHRTDHPPESTLLALYGALAETLVN